jgi:uncharacterized protein YggE
MKNFITSAFVLIALVSAGQSTGNATYAQDSGNANYGGNRYQAPQQNTFPVTTSTQEEMTITIRGIYNEKATAKIATFSILQVGKTAEETTALMDERIAKVFADLQMFDKSVEVVTDMISFVPMYAYEVEKKIFNPKTYNEKPTGFELKKNLIIKFHNTNDMDKVLAACAKQEIYDLAKVDYVTANYDQIHDLMMSKAIEEFKQKLTNYSMIMNTDLSRKEKIIQEGYNVTYPMESYRAYQAIAAANVNAGSKEIVNTITKNTTQYYDRVPLKQHTFIVGADIAEPTIQVFYEMTVRIKLREDQLPKNTIIRNNKYYIITPAGDVKPLSI